MKVMMTYYVAKKSVIIYSFSVSSIKFLVFSFFTFALEILFIILISFTLIFLILISVAFFTLLERKKLASFQRRKGPNVEGTVSGILQPIADGFKLVFKESILPSNSVNIIFILAPIMAFCLGFAG
jgi:NADH-quinone oxidoreductase subunit H